MKKILTVENIRFFIYVVGGIIAGSFFVFNVRADIKDLSKRVCNQESKIVSLDTSDITQKIDIEVIKSRLANIEELQKETNSGIKYLVSKVK